MPCPHPESSAEAAENPNMSWHAKMKLTTTIKRQPLHRPHLSLYHSRVLFADVPPVLHCNGQHLPADWLQRSHEAVAMHDFPDQGVQSKSLIEVFKSLLVETRAFETTDR